MKKIKRYKSFMKESKNDVIDMRTILDNLRKEYTLSLREALSKVKYDPEESENVEFFKGKILGLEIFSKEVRKRITSLQKEKALSDEDAGTTAALIEIYKLLLD